MILKQLAKISRKILVRTNQCGMTCVMHRSIMSSSLSTLVSFLAVITVFGSDNAQPGLYHETCGNRNVNSVATCDTTKNLECVNGQCTCLDNYVPDGECGCKWGLVGYRAKCVLDRIFMTCDFKKNLTCDSLILRCLCTVNHVRKDDACIPGNGSYGDSCDAPEDHEFVLKTLNLTRLRVRRSMNQSDPFKFISYTAEYHNRRRLQLLKGSSNSSEQPPPVTSNKSNGSRGKETLEPEPPKMVKCDPSQYPMPREPDASEIAHDDALFFNEFGKPRRGCNPELNLECLKGKCECINEESFGMFKLDKGHGGKPRGCKRSNFYSCLQNEDCVDRNCVEFNATHEAMKLCLPIGMATPPDATDASTSHFQLLKVYLLVITQITAVYAH